MSPRLPHLVELCRFVTHSRLQRGLQHRESPTRGLWRVLRHQLSPRFEPVSVCHSLHQPRASSSGQCRQDGVWRVVQRSDSHSRFLFSCWKVRHRLRLCVFQNLHVLLVHKGEVVLELETELQPGPFVVVVWIDFAASFRK